MSRRPRERRRAAELSGTLRRATTPDNAPSLPITMPHGRPATNSLAITRKTDKAAALTEFVDICVQEIRTRSDLRLLTQRKYVVLARIQAAGGTIVDAARAVANLFGAHSIASIARLAAKWRRAAQRAGATARRIATGQASSERADLRRE